MNTLPLQLVNRATLDAARAFAAQAAVPLHRTMVVRTALGVEVVAIPKRSPVRASFMLDRQIPLASFPYSLTYLNLGA